MNACLFCQTELLKDQLVAEFSHCYVIKDRFPVTKGHLLIIPYQHFEDWFAAPREIQNDIIVIIDKMKSLLDHEHHPDGYNIGANCGQAAGQTIMHLHMHLIPRYLGDVANPRGGIRGVIPAKQSY